MPSAFPTMLVHAGLDIWGSGDFGMNGSCNVSGHNVGNDIYTHPTVLYDIGQRPASLLGG